MKKAVQDRSKAILYSLIHVMFIPVIRRVLSPFPSHSFRIALIFSAISSTFASVRLYFLWK